MTAVSNLAFVHIRAVGCHKNLAASDLAVFGLMRGSRRIHGAPRERVGDAARKPRADHGAEPHH